jgi:outer membrane receptor protein involved in Fe transport
MLIANEEGRFGREISKITQHTSVIARRRIGMKPKALLVTLVLLCVGATASWGAVTGAIGGVITDTQSGEPVVGVTVMIVGTNLGASTDVEGHYNILNVPVGTYLLQISSVGYASIEVSNVAVSADLTTYQSHAMSSEATDIGTTIRVVAEAPMVIPDKVSSVQITKADDILAMPTRGFEQVVGIQAGVVSSIQTFRGGNRSNREAVNTPELFIRGGRPIEVAYYVDGFSQQDPLTGTSTSSISNNSIQEIAVLSGGFPVEYGHVQSGIVNVVTKSGGDKYSGTAEAVTDQVYDQNWYSFDFGGPVPLIEKATFFGSVERRYMGDRSPSAVTEHLPGSPDRLPNNSLEGWSGTGKLDYGLSPTINLSLGANASRDTWRQYAHSRLFNNEHNAYYNDYNFGANFKWTHTLNSGTFYNFSGSYYETERFRGSGVHYENLWKYGRPNGNTTNDEAGLFRMWDDMNGPTPTVWDTLTVDGEVRSFIVDGDEGQVWNDYLRRKSSYVGFKGDITKEFGREHTVKGGFEFNRHTLRYYNHLQPILVYQGYADPTGNIGPGFDDANRYGYDHLGNETDDDGRDWRNKTKNPIDVALYLQDRIEYQGLIVTAGVRADFFDYKGYLLRDENLPLNPDSLGLPGKPPDDGTSNSMELEDLKESDSFTRFSPRIGVAFPVSDKSQLRISYGRFYQRPRLQDLYVGFDFMEYQLLGSGYYTQWGNPNLKPPTTTAYEVGITQQFGDNTSFDVNLFYRATKDMIQTVDQPSMPNSFGTFRNQDYGTIQGMEFTWAMRRTNNIMFNIKYTLTYATGTGSFNTEQRNVAWVKAEPPKASAPLDYDQRHKINAVFDLRFGAGQGPKIGDTYFLQNFGVNFLVSTGSGLPYTPTSVYNEASRGSLSPTPEDTRNSRYMPWNMTIDMKAEKTLMFGQFKVTPYLVVKNLLDKENVINVWEGTGKANPTGFLETELGQTLVEQFEEPTDNSDLSYEEKYNIAQQRPIDYGPPRQILFGLRVAF